MTLMVEKLAMLQTPRGEADWIRPAGRVRSIAAVVSDRTVSLTATGNVRASEANYFWYVNSNFFAWSRSPQKSFLVTPGRPDVIDVRVSRRRKYDPLRSPPVRPLGYRVIEWVGSDSADTDHYLVQFNRASAGWVTFDTIAHDGRWSYRSETQFLDDDVLYEFRVVPVDAQQNQGTPLAFSSERIVRHPDPIDHTVTWDSGTGNVTFTGV